jgi:hypothetical protein
VRIAVQEKKKSFGILGKNLASTEETVARPTVLIGGREKNDLLELVAGLRAGEKIQQVLR